MTPLQKLPKNVRDLGKLIAAKGFKKLPKVQKIAQSDHTGHNVHLLALATHLSRLGRGCRSVGRAVASDTRGLRFKSSHAQIFIQSICLLSSVWKYENIEKEAGNGPLKSSLKTCLGM